MKRLINHVAAHPVRSFVTMVATTMAALATAGVTLVTSLENSHDTSVAVCLEVNELSRKIYVTLADLGFAPHQIRKFLPTQHCEDIP